MSKLLTIDEKGLEELSEFQLKFVIKALFAGGHVKLWAVDEAIKIATNFSKRED